MIFYYFLLYFTLLFILLPKYEKTIYLSFWKHISYFIWYFFYGSSPLLFKILSLIGYIFILLFYPILPYIYPKLKFSYYNTVMYIVQPALEYGGYEIVKQMNSKIFWYKIFKKYKIRTPELICYYNGKLTIYKKPQVNTLYLSKPEYGSNGNNVNLLTFDQFSEYIKNYLFDNYVLQEYINDCFKKNRTIRIITKSILGNVEINQYMNQQYSDYIASNVMNKTVEICNIEKCHLLSSRENKMVKNIADELLNLHKNEFSFVPYIGWDIILSCNGPIVLEGNIATALYGVNRNDFSKDIISIYKKMSY